MLIWCYPYTSETFPIANNLEATYCAEIVVLRRRRRRGRGAAEQGAHFHIIITQITNFIPFLVIQSLYSEAAKVESNVLDEEHSTLVLARCSKAGDSSLSQIGILHHQRLAATQPAVCCCLFTPFQGSTSSQARPGYIRWLSFPTSSTAHRQFSCQAPVNVSFFSSYHYLDSDLRNSLSIRPTTVSSWAVVLKPNWLIILQRLYTCMYLTS